MEKDVAGCEPLDLVLTECLRSVGDLGAAHAHSLRELRRLPAQVAGLDGSVLAGTNVMTATTSLPTMFGRYTAILSDHQHLGEALRRLGDLCVALESDEYASSPGPEPARIIEDFARELAEHFAAEQEDAYFGTMGRERPELASAIADLELEHATMLQTLSELATAARDPSRWRVVARGMRRLIEELRAHEHRETQVMQRFILREEGTGAD